MTPRSTSLTTEFFDLLEALCEDRLTPANVQRLEQLVLSDVTARRVYLAYLDLHGTLHWNAAFGPDGTDFQPATTRDAADFTADAESKIQRRLVSNWWVLVASVAAVAALSFALGSWSSPFKNNDSIAVKEPLPTSGNREVPQSHPGITRDAASDQVNKPVTIGLRQGLEKPGSVPTDDDSTRNTNVSANQPNRKSPSRASASNNPRASPASGSVQNIVAVINEHLAAGWKLQGVEPSPVADDGEWLRRVFLDVVGHIPPVDVAERFLADRNPRKREKLVEQLLDDPDYVRHWTAVWTNLLVGRTDNRPVNRAALQKFLRESFARNRPWNETVAAFVSAEGSFEENGATNFLLAHMNNQMVPATTITARVFLGEQIGCTQCHDHPFNDWKQETFWSFHSFFEQTAVAQVEHRDARSGKLLMQPALKTKAIGGPTHFETRRGLMQVTYPRFEETRISEESDVNRRRELAKLMTSGERPQIAQALVNRLWGHFFGHGFTRPVDDMGPHNLPSHPELLDHLAREFVASGYDLKQVMRWICLSDAYHRTSRFGQSNGQDNPESGSPPLFSRVYVKGMTAEQLYDSLLLATGADKTPLQSGEHDRRRHEWLQQFVRAFGTDENDESVAFESDVNQALLLMNSELTQKALSLERGTFLESLVHSRDGEAEKIKRLCLAALTRYPTAKEQAAIRRVLSSSPSTASRANGIGASANGWQDALWAYLNSSEFILVH